MQIIFWICVNKIHGTCNVPCIYMCIYTMYLHVQNTCKYMVITRKRSNSLVPPVITLTSSVIERTYSYKYLGVTISSDLSWSEHIHTICTKARRTVGLLYRNFYVNSDTTSLLQLYVSLVRPLLEYACQVWHPHLVRDIAKLERVQKLALRLCTKQWTLNYSTLLSLSIFRNTSEVLLSLYHVQNCKQYDRFPS